MQTVQQLAAMRAPSVAVDTSEAAADALKSQLSPLRERTLLAVGGALDGMTCDELEQHTGLSHQTAAARLWELEGAGFVYKAKQYRMTRRLRAARVYKLTPRGEQALRACL